MSISPEQFVAKISSMAYEARTKREKQNALHAMRRGNVEFYADAIGYYKDLMRDIGAERDIALAQTVKVFGLLGHEIKRLENLTAGKKPTFAHTTKRLDFGDHNIDLASLRNCPLTEILSDFDDYDIEDHDDDEDYTQAMRDGIAVGQFDDDNEELDS